MPEILAKSKFTEEAAKSIVGDGINRGEDLEHLDYDMFKSFVQNFCKPSYIQDGVVVSTMAEVFLKLLI